jgi:large subunit ribosomal protein L22
MAKYNYSYKPEGESYARAVGRDLSISTKHSIEICKFIKHKNLSLAKKELSEVLNFKRAVPFTRFNRGGVGHRPGMGPGRYPIKAVEKILYILNNVENNAKQKGLDIDALIIKHASAQKGYQRLRYGRKPRRSAKRTHVEIVVFEIVKENKDKVQEKSEKQGHPKPKSEKNIDKPKSPAKKIDKSATQKNVVKKEKSEGGELNQDASSKNVLKEDKQNQDKKLKASKTEDSKKAKPENKENPLSKSKESKSKQEDKKDKKE